MGVGMPHEIRLREFGEHVFAAFGQMPYHVGSSLREKHGWRDVDVRVMLPDDEYERAGFGDPARPQENRKWVAMTLAWSAFGHHLTGLPIDFQVQQLSSANREFTREKGCARSALFVLHTACPVAPPPHPSGAEESHPQPRTENP